MKQTSFVSTNFYMMILTFLTSTVGFVGIDLDPAVFETVIQAAQGKEWVAFFVGLVGLVALVYNTVKVSVLTKFTDIFKERNWYTALVMLAGGIFSWLKYSNFPEVESEQLVDALFAGDIGLAISTGWAVVMAIIKMIQNGTFKFSTSTD